MSRDDRALLGSAREDRPPKAPLQIDQSGPPSTSIRKRLLLWAAVFGPGLIVMLADTDAGSIITAVQSGIVWKYTLIVPQLLLIPVLYIVQEITVRLGAITRKGHAELIRDHFGPVWSFISVGTLFVSGIGALVTEYVGVAEAGALFGIPPVITVTVAVTVLITVVLSGSYFQVERIGILAGLLELLFVVAVLVAHPSWITIARGASHLPMSSPDYRFMLGANVGAVVMPWMIFYQQGAVVDKGLRGDSIKKARIDTLVGAVLTQVVMITVIIAVAASSQSVTHQLGLSGVRGIAAAFRPIAGPVGSKLIAALGMGGAALTAAIVVSLASAWSVGELTGRGHSVNLPFRKARVFYLAFIVANLCAAALVLSGISLVHLTLDIEVMNALLLPLVLGFLLAIEQRSLPHAHRMKGVYKVVAWTISLLIIGGGIALASDILLR